MSRNGGGVYSLPGTYEATPGETILAEQHNDPLEDLEQDANTARPIVAGGTGAITAIAAHDNLSTKGADVASAATTDIGAATGSYIHITGTTGITALGTKTAGVLRDVVFDGILTLTHNATSLILPGGANITTAAGDTATFRSEGGGNWRCLRYTRASGQSVVGGGKGTAVASASTISLGSELFYHITGTTTITDIDFTVPGDGRWAILEFDGALTLTHNGTTLVLPGAANITTAAGDICVVVQDSGDNVHVVSYQRAAVVPLAGGWEHIATVAPSAAASVDRTNLAVYRRMRITGCFVAATDNVNLLLLTSTNNGSSYDTGATDYVLQAHRHQGTNTTAASTATTYFPLNSSATIGNAGNERIWFEIIIDDFNQAAIGTVNWRASWLDTSGVLYVDSGGGYRNSTTARNAARLIFSTGAIASGSVTFEGIRG